MFSPQCENVECILSREQMLKNTEKSLKEERDKVQKRGKSTESSIPANFIEFISVFIPVKYPYK